MPEETAEVQEEVSFPDDPMGQIREEDALRRLHGLETSLGNDQSTEAEETAGGESESSEAPETPAKRLPHDRALEELAKSNPELAESYRAMQSDYTRSQQKLAEIDRNLDATVQAAVERTLADSAPVEDVTNGQLTPEQEELFEQVAIKRGFVRQGDLEARTHEDNRKNYLVSGQLAAIEEYGDAFGHMEGEELVFAPGVEAKMNERYTPIKNNGAMNLNDLYILTYHTDLLKQARAEGIEEGRKLGGVARQERTSARTEQGNIGADLSVNIRGQDAIQDKNDKVWGRAALMARKSLGLSK